MLKIVLAGAVGSTFATLQKLVQHGFDVAGVLGYEPQSSALVSGYVHMRDFCEQHAIPYFPFKKIGAPEVQELVASLAPDLFFVVGLSQLVPESLLKVARLGNVGFHPTMLPAGRGRAPIAWLILEEDFGAANFFLMSEGVDDGPLFVQEKFPVADTDDAAAIEQKILQAIDAALDCWLPELARGIWNPIPQDEAAATYYGKRGPEDGWIDWSRSAAVIDKIIRASAPPHPGAYTFLKDRKLTVLQSFPENSLKIRGVPGSVLQVAGERFLVQAGEGLLWIADVLDETGASLKLKVGERLGYYSELEIYHLKKEIALIKQKLGL